MHSLYPNQTSLSIILEFFCGMNLWIQDLLPQKLRVAAKDPSMVLDCARWRRTYVQTVTHMHFGTHSIHRKRLTGWSFSRLFQEPPTTWTLSISQLFWPWTPTNTNLHYTNQNKWYFLCDFFRNEIVFKGGSIHIISIFNLIKGKIEAAYLFFA